MRPFLFSCFDRLTPLMTTKLPGNDYYTHLLTKFQLLKHLLEQVINESLKNKKNFEESSKNEGGDEKHIYFFT